MIAFMRYRGGFELAFLHVGHGVRRDGPGRIAIMDHRPDGHVVQRARLGDVLVRLSLDSERYLRIPGRLIDAALVIVGSQVAALVPFGWIALPVGLYALHAHRVGREYEASRA